MNTHFELREKIKNREAYFSAFNELRKRSNTRSVISCVLGLSVGLTSLINLLSPSSPIPIIIFAGFISILIVTFSFIPFFWTKNLDSTNDHGHNKFVFYDPIDILNGFKFPYFLSGRFWKERKELSYFNSYEEYVYFLIHCEPLDKNSVAQVLKSLHEFSLEETELFKECLVYREELGYWPKFLLKMSDDIEKEKLNVTELEISSLEGLSLNAGEIELESITRDKIEIEPSLKYNRKNYSNLCT